MLNTKCKSMRQRHKQASVLADTQKTAKASQHVSIWHAPWGTMAMGPSSRFHLLDSSSGDTSAMLPATAMFTKNFPFTAATSMGRMTLGSSAVTSAAYGSCIRGEQQRKSRARSQPSAGHDQPGAQRCHQRSVRVLQRRMKKQQQESQKLSTHAHHQELPKKKLDITY
jgi:hypothetical protein